MTDAERDILHLQQDISELRDLIQSLEERINQLESQNNSKTDCMKETINQEVESLLNKWSDGRYKWNDNNGNPKTNYLLKLTEMDEDKLYEETKSKIWLSAFASNNHRSDYHWHCDACYDLLSLRGKSEVYTKAHKSVSNSL